MDGSWPIWKFYDLYLKGQLFSQEGKKRINSHEEAGAERKALETLDPRGGGGGGEASTNNCFSALVISHVRKNGYRERHCTAHMSCMGFG